MAGSCYVSILLRFVLLLRLHKKYTIKDYQAKCKAETLRECETPWQIVDVYSLKELLISVDNYVQFRFGGNYWETIKRVIWRKSIGNQLNIRNRKNDGC